ncbi:MAG: outer membrane lipoprotein-sorting protein [Acidobacteria bacterium]|nr:outer membrane lipoprotein-sorting protein [Acidobacteriota bacterium]
MERVDQQARCSSRQYTGSLEVYDRGGKVLRKAWLSRRKGFGGESRSLVRFTSPPEVRGVGLLVLAHRGVPSDQWLYTPAIRRDRRIAPQDRSVRFLGTDFSYEDMQEREVADYQYSLIGEEASGAGSFFKIQAVPNKNLRSQYAYLYVWVDKNLFVVTRTEFYRDKELSKTLAAGKLERIQGIWTALELEMKDLKRGSRTVVRMSDVQYNKFLSDDLFTLRNLRDGDR